MASRKIDGKLIVSPQFSMRWSGNPVQSGRCLLSALKRGHGGARVVVKGGVEVGSVLLALYALSAHESEPLKQSAFNVHVGSLHQSRVRTDGKMREGIHRLQER